MYQLLHKQMSMFPRYVLTVGQLKCNGKKLFINTFNN